MRRKLLRFSSLFPRNKKFENIQSLSLVVPQTSKSAHTSYLHTCIAGANGWTSGIGKHTVNKSVTSRHAAAVATAAAREKKNFREKKIDSMFALDSSRHSAKKSRVSQSREFQVCARDSHDFLAIVHSWALTEDVLIRSKTLLTLSSASWSPSSFVHAECNLLIEDHPFFALCPPSRHSAHWIHKSVIRANCQPLYSSHKKQKRTLKLKTTASRARPAEKVTRLIKKSN